MEENNMTKLTKEQALAKIEELKKYVDDVETKVEKSVGIAIKSRWAGATVVYQSTKTTMREAVVEAVESGADLSGADLRDANLYGADLRDADLRDADLRNANLRSADLRSADLRSANLRGADLCSANLRGADLCSANLRDADLRDANLRDADLRDANLRDAELQNAKFYGKGGTKVLKRSQLPDFVGALGFIIEAN
jgi:uncharacterized protein YjbI with pentapeptide repeats